MNEVIQGVGKSKMRLYFATALLTALAVTGSLFAYAYTITSTSLNATGTSADFGNIVASTGNTVPPYSAFGSYRGKIGAGNLFDVTPDTNYTGDIGINVYLNNMDQIGYKYGMFMVTLQLVNSSNQSVDVDGVPKPITLQNGAVSFTSTNMTGGTTYYIQCKGGVYRTFPGAYLSGAGGSWTPSFTAEIVQAGL